MVGTLFLMIKFIFKFDGKIETAHVYNRATCCGWVGGGGV